MHGVSLFESPDRRPRGWDPEWNTTTPSIFFNLVNPRQTYFTLSLSRESVSWSYNIV